jgi:methyl-accepting chemotaxis protein
MVQSISAAADEQSSGIAEITTNISSLDDATQKNVSMFEETNKATQVLAREVATLSEIAASFVLPDEVGTGHPEAAAFRRAS